MCKPFIKWVGGKGKMLPTILEHVPKKFNRYHEPFVGGGALFFNLGKHESFINDYNPDLINAYEVVRDSPVALMDGLSKLENTKEKYYEIRGLDRKPEEFKAMSNLDKAIRFIYLNKTAFNGMWRVNKSGQHNTPYGKMKISKYVDASNLLDCSKLLQYTSINNRDFEAFLDIVAKEGDFVYIDPPYVPVSNTGKFTEYTDCGFDSSDQARLLLICDELNERGVKFMMSNSSTDVVRFMYSKYKIVDVKARRSISASASGRLMVTDLLIKNY